MEGELSKETSFYFRGPEEKLNLRAQNLMVFLQLAQGVDDATWLHHLHQGDYAHWFRTAIKDTDLAEETIEIGKRQGLSASESRSWSKQLLKSVTQRQHDARAAGVYSTAHIARPSPWLISSSLT